MWTVVSAKWWAALPNPQKQPDWRKVQQKSGRGRFFVVQNLVHVVHPSAQDAFTQSAK